MGNYWKGTSYEYLQDAEIALLKRAGLSENDYVIRNTQIEEDDPEKYIHCVEVLSSEIPEAKRKTMPKMVLVHGYGAGGCYFFKVIKDLS